MAQWYRGSLAMSPVLRLPPAGLQHDLGLIEAIGVGESGAVPQPKAARPGSVDSTPR